MCQRYLFAGYQLLYYPEPAFCVLRQYIFYIDHFFLPPPSLLDYVNQYLGDEIVHLVYGPIISDISFYRCVPVFIPVSLRPSEYLLIRFIYVIMRDVYKRQPLLCRW